MIDGADATAGANPRFRREMRHNRRVVARAHRRVEINDLNLGESREALQHDLRRVPLQSLLTALHELDDFAAEQIDARKDHRFTLLTGMPSLSRYSFKSFTVYVP